MNLIFNKIKRDKNNLTFIQNYIQIINENADELRGEKILTETQTRYRNKVCRVFYELSTSYGRNSGKWHTWEPQ